MSGIHVRNVFYRLLFVNSKTAAIPPVSRINLQAQGRGLCWPIYDISWSSMFIDDIRPDCIQRMGLQFTKTQCLELPVTTRTPVLPLPRVTREHVGNALKAPCDLFSHRWESLWHPVLGSRAGPPTALKCCWSI